MIVVKDFRDVNQTSCTLHNLAMAVLNKVVQLTYRRR